MPDELDVRLLRCFASSRQPLTDPPFVVRVMAQLPSGGGRGWGNAVRGAALAMWTGLAAGIAAPLRLRYAGIMALGLVVVTLWSVLQAV
jgi:hypothetical protein